jgi:hypothetical protein
MTADIKREDPMVNDEERTAAREVKAESADLAADPKSGEDPGLLPMNEDPRERRLKRNTM